MKDYKIYVVIMHTKSVLAKLINRVNHEKYTHSVIMFEKDLSEMYGFGRKHWWFPFYGVFRKESLNEGFLKRHKILQGAVLEAELTEKQYKKAFDIVETFKKDSKKYVYNVKGLFYLKAGKVKKFENKFFCSEFVYHVLYEAGIVDFHKERGFVSPYDFYQNLNLVYEGDLKKFTK